MVTILPRSSWTTTPFAWSGFSSRLFDKARVTYLAPHYPAIPQDLGVLTEAQEQGWMRTVRSWHVDGNGWADIGYALVIFQSGRIYMAGGITHSTAHAGTANPVAIGVLFMVGNDEPPSPAALAAFNQLGPWLRDSQDFSALSTVTDHGRLPGQATACAGPHVRAAIDTGALTLTAGGTMPIAENGWSTIPLRSTATFLAPNGKIVYCHPAVRDILAYAAWRWHFSVGPLGSATYLEGDSETNHRRGVRDGLIVIHSWRPAAKIAGSNIYSIHGTGLAMDVNGHLHPYEYNNPNWRSGFTNAQVAALRKIKTEVRALAGGTDILRLGIDFPVGRRDGMHVELWGSLAKMQATSAAVRNAGWIIPWRRGDIAAYQAMIGTTADDFHGAGTTRAMQAAQRSRKLGQTGRWDVPTQTMFVQEHLTRLGYSVGKVDGIPGSLFVDGVKAFQRTAKLTVDGIPGRDTLRALFAAPTPAPTPPTPPTPPSGPDYSNYTAAQITEAQRLLLQAGWDPRGVDGIPGAGFQAAMRTAQTELARLGLYRDAIDLLPGPNFMAAIRQHLTPPPAVPVHRIAGSTRYATAVDASSAALPGGKGVILYVDDTPDAGAAVLLGARTGHPTLPVRASGVPGVVAAHLTRLAPAWVAVVGGTTAFPDTTAQTAAQAAAQAAAAK